MEDKPPQYEYGQPAPDQYGQPAPGQYGQPAPGQYGQPAPGQYGQPAPGQYGQPAPGQYGQPAPGQYGQPAPGQYGQPLLPGQYGGMQPQGQYGMQPPPPAGMYHGQPGLPVMAQPTPTGQPQYQWMTAPAAIAGCPVGLEYLAHLDQVILKQEVSVMELVTGWECSNKFRVFNSMGQQIYFATEESDFLQRQCCGPQRGFIYHFTDTYKQEVFRVRREFQCCTGVVCCPGDCCRYFAVCESLQGETLGYISNLQFCCTPHFAIYDERQEMVAQVRGPTCPCQNMCCTDDINFEVRNLTTNSEMGVIKKTWEGVMKNTFTNCDNFAVVFPQHTDVKHKALMVGTVFIIDMMLYEKRQNRNQN